MIGIKTQQQRYLSLFPGIEKLMNDLPSTSLRCLLMAQPSQRMQRNRSHHVCACFVKLSADTPATIYKESYNVWQCLN
jgi:hypothetical protein